MFQGQPGAVLVFKDGAIRQFALDLTGKPGLRPVREMKLATQAEGCVIDDRTGTLYVAEEDVGVWRFDVGATTPIRFAAADGAHIVADAEGLALAPEGANGGLLVVSSQGDSAYAAYRLPDGGYVGRFRVAVGAFGATEEIDGIEIALGGFDQTYRGGLFVAQDGMTPSGAQNFKLVDWADIATLLDRR